MATKLDRKEQLKILHSIDSFGILKVSLSSIRIEKLEERIRPGVPFPHKHDFFQIMLVTSGSGLHQIDFEKHKVIPNQMFLMKPGQMHSWALSKNVKGFIVEFNHQSMNAIKDSSKLIDDFSNSPDAYSFTNRKNFKEIVRLTEMMIHEFETKREMHDLSLQGYLASFLILIIRSYQAHLKQHKTLSVLEKFKDLLEKNFKQVHAVEFYARELKTSPKALTMQFSRSLGKPPSQLIQDRILLEAKRFLAFSHLSIAEIGYELGFEDANYFSRFFRKHMKKTPAQFRKEA